VSNRLPQCAFNEFAGVAPDLVRSPRRKISLAIALHGIGWPALRRTISAALVQLYFIASAIKIFIADFLEAQLRWLTTVRVKFIRVAAARY